MNARRLLSALLAFVFIWDTVAWSAPRPSVPSPNSSLLTQIQIPENIGSVKERFFKNPSPFIIHIQDAHSHPEAQRNIEALLADLAAGKKIHKIAVEGAFGKIDPQFLNLFPRAEANQAMAEYLVGKGELTGAELYALQHRQSSVEVRGVDERELYQKSFQIFQKVKSSKEEIERWLTACRRILEKLEAERFNHALGRFFSARKAWEKNPENALQYLKLLNGYAGKFLGLHLTDPRSQYDWPNLSRIAKASSVEGWIRVESARSENRTGTNVPVQPSVSEAGRFGGSQDFRRLRVPGQPGPGARSENRTGTNVPVQPSVSEAGRFGGSQDFRRLRVPGQPGPGARSETEALIRQIRTGLKDRGERDFLIEGLRLLIARESEPGRFSAWLTRTQGHSHPKSLRHFLERLDRKTSEARISLFQYPHFLDLAGFLVLREEVDVSGLADEVEKLQALLEEKLAHRPKEKRLLELIHDFSLVEKLLNLQLSRREFDAYQKRKETLAAQSLAFRLGEFEKQDSPEALNQEVFQWAEEFYLLSRRRDQALLQNTLALAPADPTQATVLITGGFHTDGLTEALKEKGISHLIITPRMTHFEDEGLYEKVMSGRNNRLDYLLRPLGALAAQYLAQERRAYLSGAATPGRLPVQLFEALGAGLHWYQKENFSPAEIQGALAKAFSKLEGDGILGRVEGESIRVEIPALAFAGQFQIASRGLELTRPAASSRSEVRSETVSDRLAAISWILSSAAALELQAKHKQTFTQLVSYSNQTRIKLGRLIESAEERDSFAETLEEFAQKSMEQGTDSRDWVVLAAHYLRRPEEMPEDILQQMKDAAATQSALFQREDDLTGIVIGAGQVIEDRKYRLKIQSPRRTTTQGAEGTGPEPDAASRSEARQPQGGGEADGSPKAAEARSDPNDSAARLALPAHLQRAIAEETERFFIKKDTPPADQQKILDQNQKASAVLAEALDRLKSLHPSVVQIIEDLYPQVLPYLIQSYLPSIQYPSRGEKISPVHHVAHVLNFMSEILIGENASPEEVKHGMVAALFHDAGIAEQSLPKITEQNIIDLINSGADAETVAMERLKAAASRKEHPDKGVKIAHLIIGKYRETDPAAFSNPGLQEILRIVLNHDNPKIAILDHLIGRSELNSEDFIKSGDRLMQMHREADALWMVSPDGIEADLDRYPEDKKPAVLKIIKNNINLHHLEASLYREAFGAEGYAKYQFIQGSLYRTETGYRIFKREIGKLKSKYLVVDRIFKKIRGEYNPPRAEVRAEDFVFREDTVPPGNAPKSMTILVNPKKIRVSLSIQPGYPYTPDGVPREGSAVADPTKLRENVWTLEKHVEEWVRQHADGKILAITGNGNLKANPFFVSWGDGKLHHLASEPLDKRTYPSLVVWRDHRVSIEDLTYDKRGEHVTIKSGGREVTEEILTATFGVPLLREGKVEPLANILEKEYVYDLRGVFVFPYWRGIRGVYIGDGQVKEDFQEMKKRGKPQDSLLLKAARGEPISFDLSDSLKTREGDLVGIGQQHDILKNSQYQEVTTDRPLKPGEYRIRDRDNHPKRIEIVLLENRYPHHAVGVTQDDRWIDWIIGGKQGLEGVTLSELAAGIQEKGAFNALLIDSGGDVVAYDSEQDGPAKKFVLEVARDKADHKWTSLIVYAVPEQEPPARITEDFKRARAEVRLPGQPPGSTPGPRRPARAEVRVSYQIYRGGELPPIVRSAIHEIERINMGNSRMPNHVLDQFLNTSTTIIIAMRDSDTQRIFGYRVGLRQSEVPETHDSRAPPIPLGRSFYEISRQVLPAWQARGFENEMRRHLLEEVKSRGYQFFTGHQEDWFGEEDWQSYLRNLDPDYQLYKGGLIRSLPPRPGTQTPQQYYIVDLAFKSPKARAEVRLPGQPPGSTPGPRRPARAEVRSEKPSEGGTQFLGRPEISPERRAIIFGTGRVARAHLAEIWAGRNGGDVIFVSRRPEMVELINKTQAYQVKPVGGDPTKIEHVNALYAGDPEQLVAYAAHADWIFTAVGTESLLELAVPLRAMIEARAESPRRDQPFNIIFAENFSIGQRHLQELKEEILRGIEDPETKNFTESRVGFIGAVVQPDIPDQLPDPSQPLDIVREGGNYELIVDAPSSRGPPENLEAIHGFLPVNDIDSYRTKKFLIFNLGHAILAYLADEREITYLAEGMQNPKIRSVVQQAMEESAEALPIAYPLFSNEELKEYVKESLSRFSNLDLKDTVKRVARDPLRKLRPTDRLLRAAQIVKESKSTSSPDYQPHAINLGIAAAIRYARRYGQMSDEKLKEILDNTEKLGLDIRWQDPAFAKAWDELVSAAELRKRLEAIRQRLSHRDWRERVLALEDFARLVRANPDLATESNLALVLERLDDVNWDWDEHVDRDVPETALEVLPLFLQANPKAFTEANRGIVLAKMALREPLFFWHPLVAALPYFRRADPQTFAKDIRLTLDVGGTSVRIGLIESDTGGILSERVFPMDNQGRTAIVSQLVDLVKNAFIEALKERRIVSRIVIGFPARFSLIEGQWAILDRRTNLAGEWYGYPLPKEIERQLKKGGLDLDEMGTSLRVISDDQAAAEGELLPEGSVAKKGLTGKKILAVTLGTGIGGILIKEDQVYLPNPYVGWVEELTPLRQELPALVKEIVGDESKRKFLNLATGTALAEWAKAYAKHKWERDRELYFGDSSEGLEEITGRSVSQALIGEREEEKKVAQELLQGIGRNLALGVISLVRGELTGWERVERYPVDILEKNTEEFRDVEAVIFGGGLAEGHSGEIIEAVANETLAQAGYPHIRVYRSVLEGRAGILGGVAGAPRPRAEVRAVDYDLKPTARARRESSSRWISSLTTPSLRKMQDWWRQMSLLSLKVAADFSPVLAKWGWVAGRTKSVAGRVPGEITEEMKATRMSSPKTLTTTAGRTLRPERSVKGKGTRTISPRERGFKPAGRLRENKGFLPDRTKSENLDSGNRVPPAASLKALPSRRPARRVGAPSARGVVAVSNVRAQKLPRSASSQIERYPTQITLVKTDSFSRAEVRENPDPWVEELRGDEPKEALYSFLDRDAGHDPVEYRKRIDLLTDDILREIARGIQYLRQMLPDGDRRKPADLMGVLRSSNLFHRYRIEKKLPPTFLLDPKEVLSHRGEDQSYPQLLALTSDPDFVGVTVIYATTEDQRKAPQELLLARASLSWYREGSAAYPIVPKAERITFEEKLLGVPELSVPSVLDEALRVAQAARDLNPFWDVSFDGASVVLLARERSDLEEGAYRKQAFEKWAASAITAKLLLDKLIVSRGVNVYPPDMKVIEDAALRVQKELAVEHRTLAATGEEAFLKSSTGAVDLAWHAKAVGVVENLRTFTQDEEVISRLGLQGRTKLRVAIQGFGYLASEIIEYLRELEEAGEALNFEIVGVSDVYGGVYDPEGISMEDLVTLRDRYRETTAAHEESNVRREYQNMTDSSVRPLGPINDFFREKFEADVVIATSPAAPIIPEENLGAMKERGVKILLQGGAAPRAVERPGDTTLTEESSPFLYLPYRLVGGGDVYTASEEYFHFPTQRQMTPKESEDLSTHVIDGVRELALTNAQWMLQQLHDGNFEKSPSAILDETIPKIRREKAKLLSDPPVLVEQRAELDFHRGVRRTFALKTAATESAREKVIYSDDNVFALRLDLNQDVRGKRGRERRRLIDRQRRAAYIMGKLRKRDAVPDLVEVLRDLERDPQVRANAAEALGNIGDWVASREVLEQRANDPKEHPSVRGWANWALRKLAAIERVGIVTEKTPGVDVSDDQLDPETGEVMVRGYEVMSHKAAERILEVVKEKKKTGKPALIMLPTGSTPEGLYKVLRETAKAGSGVDFSDVILFHLDEYIFDQDRFYDDAGKLKPTFQEQTYKHFIETHVVKPLKKSVKPRKFYTPIEHPEALRRKAGESEDDYKKRTEQVAQDYEKKLTDAIKEAGGIDLVVLGIGGGYMEGGAIQGGHIAFNESGEQSHRRSKTRVAKLSEKTRLDAQGRFGGLHATPHYAITVGMKRILEAKEILMLASGEDKAAVVEEALNGQISSNFPASFLRLSEKVTYYLDRDAAVALPEMTKPWLFKDEDPKNRDWRDPRLVSKAVYYLLGVRRKTLGQLQRSDFVQNGFNDLLEHYKGKGGLKEIKKIAKDRVARHLHNPKKGQDLLPSNATVVFFSPHPDDDVLTSGVTLQHLVEPDRGNNVHIGYLVAGHGSVWSPVLSPKGGLEDLKEHYEAEWKKYHKKDKLPNPEEFEKEFQSLTAIPLMKGFLEKAELPEELWEDLRARDSDGFEKARERFEKAWASFKAKGFSPDEVTSWYYEDLEGNLKNNEEEINLIVRLWILARTQKREEEAREAVKILGVKGRPFGSPPARGMKPRAGTAPDAPGKPGASSAVNQENPKFFRLGYYSYRAKVHTGRKYQDPDYAQVLDWLRGLHQQAPDKEIHIFYSHEIDPHGAHGIGAEIIERAMRDLAREGIQVTPWWYRGAYEEFPLEEDGSNVVVPASPRSFENKKKSIWAHASQRVAMFPGLDRRQREFWERVFDRNERTGRLLDALEILDWVPSAAEVFSKQQPIRTPQTPPSIPRAEVRTSDEGMPLTARIVKRDIRGELIRLARAEADKEYPKKVVGKPEIILETHIEEDGRIVRVTVPVMIPNPGNVQEKEIQVNAHYLYEVTYEGQVQPLRSEMRAPRVVLFDIDGTLLPIPDRRAQWTRVAGELEKRFGVSIPDPLPLREIFYLDDRDRNYPHMMAGEIPREDYLKSVNRKLHKRFGIKGDLTAEDAPAPMRWDSKAAAKLEVSLPAAPGKPGVSEAAGFFEPPEPEAEGVPARGSRPRTGGGDAPAKPRGGSAIPFGGERSRPLTLGEWMRLVFQDREAVLPADTESIRQTIEAIRGRTGFRNFGILSDRVPGDEGFFDPLMEKLYSRLGPRPWPGDRSRSTRPGFQAPGEWRRNEVEPSLDSGLFQTNLRFISHELGASKGEWRIFSLVLDLLRQKTGFEDIQAKDILLIDNDEANLFKASLFGFQTAQFVYGKGSLAEVLNPYFTPRSEARLPGERHGSKPGTRRPARAEVRAAEEREDAALGPRGQERAEVRGERPPPSQESGFQQAVLRSFLPFIIRSFPEIFRARKEGDKKILLEDPLQAMPEEISAKAQNLLIEISKKLHLAITLYREKEELFYLITLTPREATDINEARFLTVGETTMRKEIDYSDPASVEVREHVPFLAPDLFLISKGLTDKFGPAGPTIINQRDAGFSPWLLKRFSESSARAEVRGGSIASELGSEATGKVQEPSFQFYTPDEIQGGMEKELGEKAILLASFQRYAQRQGISVNVPEFFVIPRSQIATIALMESLSLSLKKNLDSHLRQIEGEFVSVRVSPERVSPGQFLTLLNVGINDESVKRLGQKLGDPALAQKLYAKLIEDFLVEIDQVSRERVEEEIQERAGREGKNSQLPSWRLGALKSVYQARTGRYFPQDIHEQLHRVIQRIPFVSRTAVSSGPRNHAVMIERMAFGVGPDSFAGEVHSRNLMTGEKTLSGNLEPNTQGDMTTGLTRVEEVIQQNPETFSSYLRALLDAGEKFLKDAAQVEITIEKGKPFLLQIRHPERNDEAEASILMDLLREGVINRDEAWQRGKRVNQELLRNTKRLVLHDGLERIGKGILVSAGAASAIVVLTDIGVVEARNRGTPYILVRPEIRAGDAEAMDSTSTTGLAQGAISLLSIGAHAESLARASGIPAVLGIPFKEIDFDRGWVKLSSESGDGIVLDETNGDSVSINSDGTIYKGKADIQVVRKEGLSRNVADFLAFMLAAEGKAPIYRVKRKRGIIEWNTRGQLDIFPPERILDVTEDPKGKIVRDESGDNPFRQHRTISQATIKEAVREVLSLASDLGQFQYLLWRNYDRLSLREYQKDYPDTLQVPSDVTYDNAEEAGLQYIYEIAQANQEALIESVFIASERHKPTAFVFRKGIITRLGKIFARRFFEKLVERAMVLGHGENDHVFGRIFLEILKEDAAFAEELVRGLKPEQRGWILEDLYWGYGVRGVDNTLRDRDLPSVSEVARFIREGILSDNKEEIVIPKTPNLFFDWAKLEPTQKREFFLNWFIEHSVPTARSTLVSSSVARAEVRTTKEKPDGEPARGDDRAIQLEIKNADQLIGHAVRQEFKNDFLEIEALLTALYGGSVQYHLPYYEVKNQGRSDEKRVLTWGRHRYDDLSGLLNLLPSLGKKIKERKRVQMLIGMARIRLRKLGIRSNQKVNLGDPNETISQILKTDPRFENDYYLTMLGQSARLKGVTDIPSRMEQAVKMGGLTAEEEASLRRFEDIFQPRLKMSSQKGEKIEPFILGVVHNTARGPAKGGITFTFADTLINNPIFMKKFNQLVAAGLQIEELRYFVRKYLKEKTMALAVGMTIKSAAALLPYGGGKGHILFADVFKKEGGGYEVRNFEAVDKAADFRDRLVRNFARHFDEAGKIGPKVFIPATDFGSRPRDMDIAMDEVMERIVEKHRSQNRRSSKWDPEIEEKLQAIPENSYESLHEPLYARAIETYFRGLQSKKLPIPSWAKPFNQARMTFTSKSPEVGGSPIRSKAAGEAGIQSLEEVARLILKKETLHGRTMTVMGAGGVGWPAIEAAIKKGMEIQAISEGVRGIVYKEGEKGFTLTEISLLKKIQSMTGGFNELGNDWSGEFSMAGVRLISEEMFLSLPVDVLVLAALENVITRDNVGQVKAGILLELSNGGITNEAYARLIESGRLPGPRLPDGQGQAGIVIPDSLANAGGVTGSYYEWRGNLRNKMLPEETVRDLILKRMQHSVASVDEVRRDSPAVNGLEDSLDWRTAVDLFGLNSVLMEENNKQRRKTRVRSELRLPAGRQAKRGPLTVGWGPGLGRGTGAAVLARGSRPRASGGGTKWSRPLTNSSVMLSEAKHLKTEILRPFGPQNDRQNDQSNLPNRVLAALEKGLLDRLAGESRTLPSMLRVAGFSYGWFEPGLAVAFGPALNLFGIGFVPLTPTLSPGRGEGSLLAPARPAGGGQAGVRGQGARLAPTSSSPALPRTVVIVGVEKQAPEVDLPLMQLPQGSRVMVMDSSGVLRSAYARYSRVRIPGVRISSVRSESRLPSFSQIQKILAEGGDTSALVIFPSGFNEILSGYEEAGRSGFITSWPRGAEARLAMADLLGRATEASALRQQVPDTVLSMNVPANGLTRVFIPRGAEDRFAEFYLSLSAQEALRTAA